MSNLHSIYSPSRLARIIACPASVMATQGVGDTKPSAYAKEGTELHRITAEAFELDLANVDVSCVNPEKLGLVEDCLDFANVLIQSMGHTHYATGNELKVTLTSWGLPEVFGTLDWKLMDYRNKHLHIVDWKFGSGVRVDATWNPQLLAYAAGETTPLLSVYNKITCHVFQPAIDHYSKFSLSMPELRKWVHTVLAPAIIRSQDPNAPFNPGLEQCRWCDIAATCKARHEHQMETAKQIFAVKSRGVNQVSTEELVEFVELTEDFESYIKEVKEYLFRELEAGREVPGYKLVRGRANRAWLDEKKAQEYLLSSFEPDQVFEAKFISPAKAEKLDRKLKSNKEFQQLIFKPEGKLTMAPEKDPREAVQTASTASIFADYIEEE